MAQEKRMAQEKTVNIKEKFGNLFFDVTKYIITAVIITPLFNEMINTWWMVGAGFVAAAIFCGLGVILFKLSTKKRK